MIIVNSDLENILINITERQNEEVQRLTDRVYELENLVNSLKQSNKDNWSNVSQSVTEVKRVSQSLDELPRDIIENTENVCRREFKEFLERFSGEEIRRLCIGSKELLKNNYEQLNKQKQVLEEQEETLKDHKKRIRWICLPVAVTSLFTIIVSFINTLVFQNTVKNANDSIQKINETIIQANTQLTTQLPLVQTISGNAGVSWISWLAIIAILGLLIYALCKSWD